MTRRSRRLGRAVTLVPLAMLSAAWTANVAGISPTSTAAPPATPKPKSGMPTIDVPSIPYAGPVSVSGPQQRQPATRAAMPTADVVATSASAGIPAAALAAYQRAATVIDDADRPCHLDWPLLAAIGRVESDHGRVGGSHLSVAGVATPAILGPRLTGGHHTARITDTDGGRYDGDTNYDRAVGPMQFIPSTWSQVGVDADGDGKRDPQDINDAALATAVYLCSGSNLSTLAGQRDAVYRYNHSHAYVAAVLGIAAAYRAGDYTSAPNDVVPSVVLVPVTAGAPGTGPTGPLGTTPPQPQPAGGRSPHSPGHGSVPLAGGDEPQTVQTDTTATEASTPADPTPSAPAASAEPAATAELQALCDQQIAATYPDATEEAATEARTQCVSQLDGMTYADAQAAAPGVVADLDGSISGLDGEAPPPTDEPDPSTSPSPSPSEPTSPEPSPSS